MNKIFSVLIAFGMLSASTPAVCHAVMHALAPAHGHTHDGGEVPHLHHEEHDHAGDFILLPPALTRRDGSVARAPAAPAGFLPAVPITPELPVLSGSGRAVPGMVFTGKYIPQLANIPPPPAAS